MIRILGTIFAGLFGLAFGSFLNVCLSRWPAGESVVKPRSHCRQCGQPLTWWENVPLVSWLALRGRCRTCRAWIGLRYPLVELAVGALWTITLWPMFVWFLVPALPAFIFYNCLAITVGKMILYWLLVALAVLDAENLWLPDWITLTGAALGLVFHVAVAYIAIRSILGGIGPREFTATLSYLLGILAAAGIILLIRWLYWLIRRREGIGLGDAKLMALLAAWLGLPGALLAFVLGVVLGALFALSQLAIPATRNQSGRWALGKLPLGTFLCIGGIVSSLWGQTILAAYRRWAGF
jgi:leader peptidase (prepilin peptidase)/N-methyltransferase